MRGSSSSQTGPTYPPDARLCIVGEGPDEPALRQMAQELGIADRVEIQGVSASGSSRHGSTALPAALVAVLSDYESQDIAVLEALALRRPVLVADTSALLFG